MNASMQHSDAFAWYMEEDPTLRATIVAVAWLETTPDWEQLVGKIDHATRQIPMFRQRVVDASGLLATPRWTADEAFDLTRHVHRLDASVPHTRDAVMALAQHAAMAPFDHAHALWDFTLVERFEGERAALIMKVHHSLTDGIGGMQLALELFDLEPAPPPPVFAPDTAAAARPRLDARPDVRDRRAWDPLGLVAFAGHTAASVVRTAHHVARHPKTSAGETIATARSIVRTLAPVNETLSPILTGRSVTRHLDILEMELADLKRAAASAGGSLNDGFMAAASGGLRRYHEHHDAPVDELRVTLPISIRKPDDTPGGNHITLIRFAVPVSDSNPGSRIRAMGRLCRVARDERSLRYTGAIAATLNLLPRAFVGGMLKNIDFLTSDIPGFSFPVYLCGARMERYVAFGPTTGTAVNLALLSYDGKCCIGVTMDTAAVADGEVLAECLRAGFEEVLALGGDHAPVRRPLRDPPVAPVEVPRASAELVTGRR
jgi:WS/DGAT/MGAT family acyltransferase